MLICLFNDITMWEEDVMDGVKHTRKTLFKAVVMAVSAGVAGERDWSQLPWSKRQDGSVVQPGVSGAEHLQMLEGRMTEMGRPSVFEWVIENMRLARLNVDM